MKEFESHEEADRYYRDVLAIPKDWETRTGIVGSVSHIEFWSPGSEDLSTEGELIARAYYTIKPKLRLFSVQAQIDVEATDAESAVKVVAGSLSFPCTVGPAKEVQ